MFLLGFVGEVRSGLNGDSAWLLHVARRVSDGARLYVDVIEVNPPLVVWLGLPVVALARATGWSDAAIFRGAIWCLALLAIWLGGRALRLLAPGTPVGWRPAVLVGMAVVLVGMPAGYFGQREHLVLILVLPWLLVAAARAEGGAPGRAVAAAAGALAGFGVALKPHYLLLPAAVAAYGWAAARTPRRLPPEHGTLAAVLACYALLAAVLAPEYLGLVDRWGPVYWDYVRRPLATILAGDLKPLTVLAALLYWPVARRLTARPRMADFLGIATAVLFVAVVLQHKGFGYHYYPAVGTGMLLVFLGLLGAGPRPPGMPVRIAARTAGALILVPILALSLGWAADRAGGSAKRGPVAAGSREIGAFLDGRAARGAVVVWSPWMDDSFPLMLERRAVWASRYPFVWFLPALYRERMSAPGPVACRREAEMSPDERTLLATVAEDLRAYRPELVFVRKPGTEGLLRIPLLECLARSGEFRREFGAYRPLVDLEHFRVFQRKAT